MTAPHLGHEPLLGRGPPWGAGACRGRSSSCAVQWGRLVGTVWRHWLWRAWWSSPSHSHRSSLLPICTAPRYGGCWAGRPRAMPVATGVRDRPGEILPWGRQGSAGRPCPAQELLLPTALCRVARGHPVSVGVTAPRLAVGSGVTPWPPLPPRAGAAQHTQCRAVGRGPTTGSQTCPQQV